MSNVEVRAEVAPGIHQSRWGYHPCDYATFAALKKLHARYMKAVTGFHSWKRWDRKQPQNRIERRTIRDADGRKVGREVVGPRAEPPLCPVFVEAVEKMVWDWDGKKSVKKPVVVRQLSPSGEHVRECLACCYPVASPDGVRHMPLKPAEIHELLARFGA